MSEPFCHQDQQRTNPNEINENVKTYQDKIHMRTNFVINLIDDTCYYYMLQIVQ